MKDFPGIWGSGVTIQAGRSVYWGACTAAVLTDICLLQNTEEREDEQIVSVHLQKEYSFFLLYYENCKGRAASENNLLQKFCSKQLARIHKISLEEDFLKQQFFLLGEYNCK